MRALVAESLLGVIHQELLSTVDGGKRVACEILVANDAVRNVLRNRGSFHLRSVIQTGHRRGMQTMKSALEALGKEGVITQSVLSSVMESYR